MAKYPISKDEAIVIANKHVGKLGYELDQMEVEVTERGHEWVVRYGIKKESLSEGNVIVFVNADSGAVREEAQLK